jgi:protein-disulfide isomerase
VLEVYSDFQCPFCVRLAAPIEQLRVVVGDQLVVRFKHFPLDFHRDAPLAHRAAIAAEEQGKFWEMHDLIFANPGRLKREDLLRYAAELGLDQAKFEAALDGTASQDRVQQDVEEGKRLGVTGTPTMRLNDKMISGARTYAQLRELVTTEAKISLPAPLSAEQLTKGPAGAPVKIELFVDLTSPLAFAAIDAVDEVVAENPARFSLRLRSFATSDASMALHQWLLAAAAQGSLWPAIYSLATGPHPDLDLTADRLRLDRKRIQSEVRNGLYRGVIQEDLVEATRLGLRGSPALAIRGQRVEGLVSPEEIRRVVSEVESKGGDQ